MNKQAVVEKDVIMAFFLFSERRHKYLRYHCERKNDDATCRLRVKGTLMWTQVFVNRLLGFLKPNHTSNIIFHLNYSWWQDLLQQVGKVSRRTTALGIRNLSSAAFRKRNIFIYTYVHAFAFHFVSWFMADDNKDVTLDGLRLDSRVSR